MILLFSLLYSIIWISHTLFYPLTVDGYLVWCQVFRFCFFPLNNFLTWLRYGPIVVLESDWLHSNPCSTIFCNIGLGTASTSMFQLSHLVHSNRVVGSAWNLVLAWYLLNEEWLSQSCSYTVIQLKWTTDKFLSILHSFPGLRLSSGHFSFP